MAGWTGLEPAAFCVTGRRSNQLSYHPEFGERRATVESGEPKSSALPSHFFRPYPDYPKPGLALPAVRVFPASMFEISGTIKKIFEEQTFGSGFNKREFVLTTEADRYPQDLKFECVKDKVALVASLTPGDKVKVFFDLRGREWKENYYVNLAAWKIESSGGPPPANDAPHPADLESSGEVFEEEPPF